MRGGKKSRASPGVTGFGRSPDRFERRAPSRRDARGRTGSSPLSIPSAAWQPLVVDTKGPWLCVAAFRRVCPFEDERRSDPSKTSGLTPECRHEDWRHRCYLTVDRDSVPGKRLKPCSVAEFARIPLTPR